MSAEEAWQEHIAGEPHWYERRYPEVKDGFMAGYRRALEDAAKELHSTNSLAYPEWLAARAAELRLQNEQLIEGGTRAMQTIMDAVTAAAADRETKD